MVDNADDELGLVWDQVVINLVGLACSFFSVFVVVFFFWNFTIT